MNVVRMSSRLVATGATAALAAAALVGVTSTAANATPVTNSYSCSNAGVGLGPWTVGLVSDAPGIENFTEIAAGVDLPGSILTVTNNFTIPAEAKGTLDAFGVESVSFPDYAGTFGNSSIGVLGMAADVADMTANGDGSWSFDANGLNDAVNGPSAGLHDVVSPASFTMIATVPGQDGAPDLNAPVDCVLTEGTDAGAYHTILVTKNASTTAGTPVAKTLKTTKVAKMKVTVGAANETPSGKVLVKEGTKTLGTAMLNDNGKATVKLGQLKKGKHSVKVVYKGDAYTVKSTSDKITFTVKKP